MGHRLSKITTRTGDDGTTGLGDGSRVPKTAPRIDAIGSVDELNSVLGMLLVHDMPLSLREPLSIIQHRLFDLGGELSVPGRTLLSEEQVRQIEEWADALNQDLPPLKEFILPGGSPASAICHLARTVCRRAERRVLHLNEQEPLNPVLLDYLNRLSDLLFIMARMLNRHANQPDVLWKPIHSRPPR